MSHHGGFDAKLGDLIGDLYEAAVDDRLWAGMASRIAYVFDSSSTVLKLHGSNVHLLETTENLAVSGDRQEWADHWHQRDLWVDRSRTLGMSRIVTDEELVSQVERARSGFYQEWLSALEIHHMVGAVFPAGNDLVGVLGIHRSRAAGAYEDRDRRRVSLFLPHLRRALDLGQRLSQVSSPGMLALDALDQIDTGVVVLNRRRRIVHANARAEQILHGCDCVRVLNGHFFLSDSRLDDRFAGFIRAAVNAAYGAPEKAGAALAIPRNERPPLMLTIAPLGRHGSGRAPQEPLALVFLRDPAGIIRQDELRALFGLTRSEAAVAADLVGGLALSEIAVTRGIGVETVRSHLKKLFAKTETSRQAEVVALIVRSVGATEIET